MNQSIRIPNTIELINITPVNPLISKCEIKVCYVGDEPNRNRSIITKTVAKQIANSLPGSPIVGYYNEDLEDFETHNKELKIIDGHIVFESNTVPYGFVDLGARVWFEKFDDDGTVHEYLMTEGYIWTGQFPEARRIIEKGNNQSMELDDKIIDAFWTKDSKGNKQFFIINEAIVSKLCILGEDEEPCFEGAQITALNFSLGDDFKNKMFSLVEEMKNILEGGASTMENNQVTEENVINEENEISVIEENTSTEEDGSATVEDTIDQSLVTGEEFVAEPIATYNLEEIVEYQELVSKYAALENDYNTLITNYETLSNEHRELKEFKAVCDKKEKENMIKSFYMLSNEEKQDVIDNIDTYSLDEIEAKLSIICVRNKVNFNLDDDNNGVVEQPIIYNLHNTEIDSTPAWVKSLQATAESMN